MSIGKYNKQDYTDAQIAQFIAETYDAADLYEGLHGELPEWFTSEMAVAERMYTGGYNNAAHYLLTILFAKLQPSI
jgi:hypothetical protein